MLRLKCGAQNYAWGRSPPHSEVARLYAKNNEIEVDDKPYAELWMGTHPSGPSKLYDSGVTLEKWIIDHPQSLGSSVQNAFGNQLPFLFKVLSVQTALSIQSHPDKALAERLHGERPEVYKDPNHKPEMAIALSEFEALCGFVSFVEVLESINFHPEIVTCIGEEITKSLKEAPSTQHTQVLKEAFTKLMTCAKSVYEGAISKLVERLEKTDEKSRGARDELLLKLNKQYPLDVGILAACFLNYVFLNEGEALYLPANEPHAYLSGEIVECMATSDNVIRAGLTPKMRDTDVLCESLTYKMGAPSLLEGKLDQASNTILYSPPFQEFEVQKIIIQPNESHSLSQDQGPSLLLVQHGEAQITQTCLDSQDTLPKIDLSVGNVFFIPDYIALTIEAKVQECILWQARVNSSLFNKS